MHWKHILVAAFIGVGIGVSVTCARAQEDKEQPEQGEDAVVEKMSEATKNVNTLSMAFDLADYGTKHKDALSLITAARIIGTMPVRKSEESADAALKLQQEAQRLINEASKMPRGDSAEFQKLAKEVSDLIRETPRAGRLGGPYVQERALDGRARTTYTHTFTPGWATIRVRNLSSGADLNIWVYNYNTGQQVAYDSSSNDDCFVQFYVPSTQRYFAKLGNRGYQKARLVYITN